jgi:hypothetical protein
VHEHENICQRQGARSTSELLFSIPESEGGWCCGLFWGGGFRFISALAYGAGHGAGPSLHFEQNFAAFTTAIFTADMIRYSTALYSSLLKEYIR